MRKIPEPPAPTPGWAKKLEEIDREYWTDPDGLGERLTKFAEERGLLAPFLKN